MNLKKYFSFVPNTITSLNVVSGSLSIVFAFNGNLVVAGTLIFIAAIFDFFDGMSARLLNAYSAMGKELDSLADVISFGLAPAVIAHLLVRRTFLSQIPLNEATLMQLMVIFSPFVLVVFSALRLAKFNIDTRQTESFIGLATPANAMIWASLPFVLKKFSFSPVAHWVSHPLIIISFSVILSLLLVAELPMFSLKFKSLKWSDNKTRFIFLGGSLVFLIFWQLSGIPLIIIWYIVLSVITNLVCKTAKTK